MATEKTAKFPIEIDAKSVSAKVAAADLQALKKAIEGSESAIKAHSAALRQLRGSSDAVKKAREELTAKIAKERGVIATNALALHKLGTSFEELKKGEKSIRATGDAIEKVGGPLADLTTGFGKYKEVLTACATPQVALGVLLALSIAAFAAFSIAVGAGVVKLTEFIAVSANALRAQGLLREAVTLGAEDAARFGRQIDSLAGKLSTPKAEINSLAVEIRKAFNNTRVSGQGIVDTLDAVATASAAAGQDTGNAIKGIIDRAKTFGRGGLGRLELQGTSAPQFTEIATALAKQMKIGVKDASLQLLQFRVPVDKLAAALKGATDLKFAEVNRKKLLDLDTITEKFHESLQALSSGVDLTPLLSGLKTITDLFSQNTVTGYSLKQIFTAVGQVMAAVGAVALPFIVAGIKMAINAAIEFGIILLQVATSLVKWSQTAGGIEAIHVAILGVKVAALGFAVVLGALLTIGATVGVGIAATFASAALVVGGVAFAIIKVVDFIRGIDWSALGRGIIDGLISGITAAKGALVNAVTGVADSVKKTFTGLLGIHSPSTIFAGYGRNTAQGFAQGVSSSNAPDDAVKGMVTVPRPNLPQVAKDVASVPEPKAAAPSQVSQASSGGGKIEHKPTYNFNFHGGDKETAKVLQAPGFLETLTHAIELANKSLGVASKA